MWHQDAAPRAESLGDAIAKEYFVDINPKCSEIR
jgi:hypothetical protein